MASYSYGDCQCGGIYLKWGVEQRPRCVRCGDFMVVSDETDKHPLSLNEWAALCRKACDCWWRDPNTGEKIDRNKAALICLMHSELSEVMEGERRDLMDDHLPHRKMAEVELADVLIRIFNYAGEYGYELDGAVQEKMAYNKTRQDHSKEARTGRHGKKF